MRALLWLTLLVPVWAQAYEKIIVVTVGVNDYGGAFETLHNAEVDANRFEQAMKQGTWQGTVNTDQRLRGPQATRAAILKALLQAGKAAGEGQSLLILYFAGHGKADGDQGFLVPYGGGRDDPTTWLSQADLVTHLGLSATKDVRHVLLVVSSCKGGLILETFRGEQPAPNHLDKKAMANALRRKARLAISAGTSKEDIPDGPPGKGSIFGDALVRALEADSEVMADDGCLLDSELETWLQKWGSSDHNMPDLGPLPKHEQGTVMLCKPGAPFGKGVDGGGRGRGDAPSPRDPEPGQVVAKATPERPALVYIPAGTFTMGSPSGEPVRGDNETPHTVQLSRPFLMMQTEVTQGQWLKRMGNNPSGFRCGLTCPVEQVNWYDVATYANALSDEEGLPACYVLRGCKGTSGKDLECKHADLSPGCTGYRLPTEAEWEYAARAGTQTAIYNGGLVPLVGWEFIPLFAYVADFIPFMSPCLFRLAQIYRENLWPKLDDIAWHEDNSDSGYLGPADTCINWAGIPFQKRCGSNPVAQKEPNDWALYDMLGNVDEWVGDWYGSYLAEIGLDPFGPASGESRVIRGGSWFWPPPAVRAAFRYYESPSTRFKSQGFRLVRRQ